MGTFTQDTAVCDELFRTGVPMWLTQLDFTITEDTIIENPVTFSFPDHIIRGMYSEGTRPLLDRYDEMMMGSGKERQLRQSGCLNSAWRFCQASPNPT